MKTFVQWLLLIWFTIVSVIILISCVQLLYESGTGAVLTEKRTTFSLVIKDVMVPMIAGLVSALIAYAFVNGVVKVANNYNLLKHGKDAKNIESLLN